MSQHQSHLLRLMFIHYPDFCSPDTHQLLRQFCREYCSNFLADRFCTFGEMKHQYEMNGWFAQLIKRIRHFCFRYIIHTKMDGRKYGERMYKLV